jgi:ribosomal peptide maturation radical SAM protein 1
MLVELRTSQNRGRAPAVKTAQRRVALVVMPVHLPEYPSLAVATLAAQLRNRGHEVDVHYLNLEAAAAVGVPTYAKVGDENSWIRNVGEWLFSHPSITPGAADTATMRRFIGAGHVEIAFEPFPDLDFDALRATFDRLLLGWEETIPWASYDVVGFTVMFQQLNASLRLSRAIKTRAPRTRVALGGCTMEHPMGDAIFARYPFLDAVFSGYADRSFSEWVEALPPRAAQPISDDGPTDLDELATPCFDEYVRTLERTGLYRRISPKVLIETSRGCWYGEKQHCTFCGMNGLQMRFRQKSGERAFAEFRELERYGLPVQAVDNILPRNYFDSLFPRLQGAGVKLDVFYELKSNANRAQLETLAEVGIKRLQPGIESLSTQVLRTMKKGVTGIQNVWFLRAAQELDMGCQWSVLWGFPGEDPAAYAEMARLFPKVCHLQAPHGCAKIHLLRYSPNHSQAKELGFTDVKPYASYALAFGEHERLSDQAYLFDYGYGDGRDPHRYTRESDAQAERWIAAQRRLFSPRCEVFVFGGRRLLFDTRRHDQVGTTVPRIHLLNDDEWALLELLESPIPERALTEKWTRPVDPAPLLARFLAENWVYAADGRIVRLVVIRQNPGPLAEAKRVLVDKAKKLKRAWRRRR